MELRTHRAAHADRLDAGHVASALAAAVTTARAAAALIAASTSATAAAAASATAAAAAATSATSTAAAAAASGSAVSRPLRATRLLRIRAKDSRTRVHRRAVLGDAWPRTELLIDPPDPLACARRDPAQRSETSTAM